MKRFKDTCLLCGFLSTLFFHERHAFGADTVETWDVGATDVDFYLGAEGIGLDKYEKTVFGDIMLGYGLVDRFSAYAGMTLEANEYLGDGSASLYLGLFGTPLETDHVDLDLFLDIGGGGAGFSEFVITPSLELNFDLDPEMRNWGAYVRAGVPVYGRDVTPEGEDAEAKFETAADVESTVGTYYTLADAHQLFLEFDMAFHLKPEEDEDKFEVGGVALGYNVMVHDAIESINQVYLDVPQGNAPIAVGLFTGIIVTLPGS